MSSPAKHGRIAAGAVAVCLMTLAGTANPAAAQGGMWTRKADVPTLRMQFAACALDGRIYAIGGYRGSAEVPAVEVYDPATDTWTRKADMPTGRDNTSACAVDGKIYVIGGEGAGTIERRVEAYDPAADTWTRKADMPFSCCEWGVTWGNCTAATVDGRIYVFDGDSPRMEAYDPATDTWTRKADVPTARWGFGVAAAGGKIYAVGGARNPTGTSPSSAAFPVEVYDPSTDTWSSGSPMPTMRCAFATSVLDGKIHAIAGRSAGSSSAHYSTVEVYDPATDTWTRKTDLPQAQAWFNTPAVSVVGGRIYVLGGTVGTTPLQSVYAYDPGRLDLVRSATYERVALSGQSAPVPVEVVLTGPLADGTFPSLVVDLTALGGSADVPLRHEGQGRYTAEIALNLNSNGQFRLPVWMVPADGPRAYLTDFLLAVLPGGDLRLFAEGTAAGWEWQTLGQVAIDTAATAQVYQGGRALDVEGSGSWTVQCRAGSPVARLGYTALSLALRPGDGSPAGVTLVVNSKRRRDLLKWVDWTQPTWQVVEVPLDSLGLGAEEAIALVTLSGTLTGTFYLDEVKLVAAPPPVTAVAEERAAAVPQGVSLRQNYPNPFNSSTVIGFQLPAAGRVELTVYDMAGQQVATLVEGERPAGSYAVTWDGRGDRSRELASGVYVYRLRAGSREESRRLLLLR